MELTMHRLNQLRAVVLRGVGACRHFEGEHVLIVELSTSLLWAGDIRGSVDSTGDQLRAPHDSPT